MKVGILAGLGTLPSVAALKLEQEKTKYVFFSLISPEHAKDLHIKHPTANNAFFLNKFHVAASLDKLQKEKITHVFCIGKVEKISVFSLAKFDTLGFTTLFSLATQSDASILQAIEKLLNECGIELIPQKNLLSSHTIKPGFQQGNITSEIRENIELGMKVAQTIAQHGIGQTIVLKNKIVIAVEGVEGTNKCIHRAYELAGAELILCKTSNHVSQKTDLPTLGIETLETLPHKGIKAIAWNAEQTLIVNPNDFIQKAQKLDIALWAL